MMGLDGGRGGARGGGGPEQFDENKYCIPGKITVHEVRAMKRAFDMIEEEAKRHAEELRAELGIPMDQDIAVLLGLDKITFDEYYKRRTAKPENEAAKETKEAAKDTK